MNKSILLSFLLLFCVTNEASFVSRGVNRTSRAIGTELGSRVTQTPGVIFRPVGRSFGTTSQAVQPGALESLTAEQKIAVEAAVKQAGKGRFRNFFKGTGAGVVIGGATVGYGTYQYYQQEAKEQEERLKKANAELAAKAKQIDSLRKEVGVLQAQGKLTEDQKQEIEKKLEEQKQEIVTERKQNAWGIVLAKIQEAVAAFSEEIPLVETQSHMPQLTPKISAEQKSANIQGFITFLEGKIKGQVKALQEEIKKLDLEKMSATGNYAAAQADYQRSKVPGYAFLRYYIQTLGLRAPEKIQADIDQREKRIQDLEAKGQSSVNAIREAAEEAQALSVTSE